MRKTEKSDKRVAKAKSAAAASSIVTNAIAKDIEVAMARFTSGDRSIDFNVDPTAETVWASQKQIADLYGVDRTVVSRHLRNLFDDGELDEAVACAKNARTASDGKTYEILEYDLDAILAVGYRISSKQASAFRRWANDILRSYIVKGYALNERRLRTDPEAADDLAARIRAIRAEERHRFAKVRDAFAIAASDYDASARPCSAFFALLQDKLHVAASGLTACRLILTRADHREKHMGLTTFTGERPVISDTKIGKNYLSETELRVLFIVSEQFLLYMEGMAARKQAMTMKDLIAKFDDLLRVQGYEVFAAHGHKDFLRKKAEAHAVAEFGMYLVRQKRDARIEGARQPASPSITRGR